MDDFTKMLVGVALLALGLLVFVLFFPKPLPNSVLVPTEQVNAGVIRFENRAGGWGDLGEELRIRVEGELVKRPGIKVFTRSRLDAILQEQRLCAVGLCDPGSAAQIGRLTGINKLVTGVILAATSKVKSVQICKEVQFTPFPSCKRSVPGSELQIEIEVQIQILNAQSGQIEVSERMSGFASESGEQVPDGGPVARRALDSLAASIANRVQAGYTREIRYGLFKGYKPKGNGYEGIDHTTNFNRADGQAVLLVQLVRMQAGDQFKIIWVDPSGQQLPTPARTVGSGSLWIPYELPLYDKSAGTWRVEGYVNEQRVFSETFSVY
jgi:hypothetical protein